MTAVSIARIGVVSSLGIGFDAFAAGLRGAAMAGSARIAHFRPAEHCGPRSVSTLDRMTQLAIAATGQALGAPLDTAARRATGVVLGSAGGGFGSISDFVRTTYTAAAPHLVSPLQFPNTVMNCAAGQSAIWHGLKGINASVCAGELSGIAALQYASRMLRGGHADTLVAGAVEEYSEFMAHLHAATPGAGPFSEGGAVFLLRAGAAPGSGLATLLGLRTRALSIDAAPDVAAQALAGAVAHLLRQVCARPADLAWRSHQGGFDASAIEAAACAQLGVPDLVPVVPDVAGLRAGASQGASSALHLAGTLALAPNGLGLLTAVSAQGMVGAILVDKHGAQEAP